jgi:hypothetical protein
MGPLRRLLLCGLADDLLNDLFGKRHLPPWTGSVFLDASDPVLDKATAPKTGGPARSPEKLRDLSVLLAFSAKQNDPRSLYHTHGHTPSSRQLLKLLTLLLGKNDWGRDSHVPPLGVRDSGG